MGLIVLASLALARPSAAADVPSDVAAQAEALFQDGRNLMASGDYAAACPKLRASMDLDPGYGTLFNLAECLSKLGKTASAWATFREAAGMAEKAGQPDRVEKANRYASELEPQLLKISIVVSSETAGLAILRDGVAVPRPAWGTALPVDPGKHVVEASAPGKTPWRAEVETVGSGGTVTVQVPALLDLASASPKAPPPNAGGSSRRLIGFALGGVGLAAAAAGGVLGGLASGRWSDAKDNHCRTPTLCDAEGVALAGDALTFANASTGLFIGGAALVGVGVVLIATGGGGGDAKGARAGLVLKPIVGSTNGVAVGGAF